MESGIKANESTRESLELLYHISRELASALDLRTVLQRVLFLSMRNVGASSGSLVVMDDEGKPVESAIIVGAQVHDRTTRQLRATVERGLAGWVNQHGTAVLVPDTSQDERWLRRPDDAEDRTGPKSAVSAPLTVRDQVVGVLTLVHPQPGFFNEDHLELVQAIADQAGIAVLNARLYSESQRQAHVMTAVAESSAVITASLRLDEVLQRILEQISQALQVQVVSLALIDSNENELEYRASTVSGDHSLLGLRLPLGKGIAGWVAQNGRGVIVPDVNKDARHSPEVDRFKWIEIRSVACAPIRSLGKVIGVIEAVNPREGSFDPDALLVLTGIGSLAGTAIRHAQLFEQLQSAHQRYHELFDDSIDPIFLTDQNGRILEANRQAEKTTRKGRLALRNLPISQLHEVNREAFGGDLTQLSTGETISYESTLYVENGIEIPIQVYVRQVEIDSLLHLQWIIRDISERKNLDSLREDLINMIYHDLRAPLGNVVSSLDVLDSMLPEDSDETLRSLLDIASRSTERIQRLTSSLLDMSRLEAGQPVGNRAPFPSRQLVRDAVDIIAPIATNKEQSISESLPDDLPDVFVEADMIRRVLSNLLENAVKFSPPGGMISFGARQEGSWIRFWVQDTGPGIPESEKERIFDKYTRLHAVDGPKGLGLGLAYCRLAVEAHGGKIWVENAADAGARFILTLPAGGKN